MPLAEVVIDERTWCSATDARRGEWRAAIQGLTRPDAPDVLPGSARLHLAVEGERTFLRLFDAAGAELAVATLTRELLAPHFEEYVDIVRQMSRTDGSGRARLEALDMAKKVAHDRAGRAIRRACRQLGGDLELARRLYTLLLVVHVDTTRLVGVHGHRRFR